MDALENFGLRRFLLAVLTLYISMGFFGNLWLADEFDSERTLLTSYAGVPAAMVFYGLCLISPKWWAKRPQTLWLMVFWLLLTFGWGNLMLLNAVGGDQAEVVDIESHQHALDIAYKRGGFGFLYRERW